MALTPAATLLLVASLVLMSIADRPATDMGEDFRNFPPPLAGLADTSQSGASPKEAQAGPQDAKMLGEVSPKAALLQDAEPPPQRSSDTAAAASLEAPAPIEERPSYPSRPVAALFEVGQVASLDEHKQAKHAKHKKTKDIPSADGIIQKLADEGPLSHKMSEADANAGTLKVAATEWKDTSYKIMDHSENVVKASTEAHRALAKAHGMVLQKSTEPVQRELTFAKTNTPSEHQHDT